MEKLKWCINKGIKLVEPNINLSKEYIKNSEETLGVLNITKKTKSNMWIATQKYYFEYFAAYAILTRFGIKSEIHSCTIEIIRFLENENIINFNLSKILEEDKELRIENQYYLKNKETKIDSKELANTLLKVKNITNSITSSKLREVRLQINELIRKEILH